VDRKKLTYAAALLFLVGCAPQTQGNPQEVAEIVGSWTGGEVLPYPRPDSQVVYFSVRPDSSLSLSMIYEVGPRSRVWTYDIDVTYGEGLVSWAYHEGRLNPGRDTLRVSKNYRGDRSDWMWVRDRGADPLLNRLGAVGPAPFSLQVPAETNDGWESAEPEAVGMDQEVLSDFMARIAEGEFGDLHSFLLARDGHLVVEEYFAENGSKHGPFIDSVFRSRVHHLASVSKTITSVLVGVAIDRGFINSVQDPTSRYLPSYRSLFDDQKEAITLEHLLTMSSGLEWSQSGRAPDHLALYSCPDVTRYVLEKPLSAEPGRRFAYSNGSAAAVGAILESATGMKVGAFAETALFRPLGIHEYLWSTYPDGTVETDGGLALRPRDLAKIGQLFLNRGEWGDAQLISEGWIDQSTRGRFRFGSISGAALQYGYFWIQTGIPQGDRLVRAFFHGGDGSQLLAVIPDLNMVVVFTGGDYGTDVNRFFYAILREYVVAAVKPD